MQRHGRREFVHELFVTFGYADSTETNLYNLRIMDRKRDALLSALRAIFVPTLPDWQALAYRLAASALLRVSPAATLEDLQHGALAPVQFASRARDVKPPLKWAGGKRWLVSHLKPIWEAIATRRYVEPFCGGLAVVLGLQPKQALLNDVNPHLINFYRHVQNGLRMRLQMRNDEALFYRHRERFNRLDSRGQGANRGRRAVVLLSEPHVLQWAVPFQQERRFQCAVRNLQGDQLRDGFFELRERVSSSGSLAMRMLRRSSLRHG